MKYQTKHLCPLLLGAFFSFLLPSVQAHPGHGLTEGGAVHWLTSPDHLAVLALAGVCAWGIGGFLRNRPFRKTLQYGGLGALALAVMLWGFGS
jgi:hypothetical protein